jgi:hypothetical protein
MTRSTSPIHVVLAVAAVSLLALLLTGSAPAGGAGAPTPACAGAVQGQQTPQAAPSPGKPCWVEVSPYPFGSDGNPIDPSACSPGICLNVTSFAFRAWNRGLAATTGGGATAFGVWLYNGTRWFPDPTFPGSGTCSGNTVLWAGKLDYWLIGQGNGASPWSTLCRFDGSNFLWQPLKIPAAALARVPTVTNPTTGAVTRAPGGVTSGSCFAWNNCWFFANFGIVLHWDGTALSDATPNLAASPWLAATVTGAVSQTAASGAQFGVAVAASYTDTFESGTLNRLHPLPAQPGGAPPQLFTSDGTAWTPTGYTPPVTSTQPSDPHQTDLVAVDMDSAGQGWAAGAPASRGASAAPQPAPLLPISPLGGDPGCAGPSPGKLTQGGPSTGSTAVDSFRWTDISAVPGSGDAIAAGSIVPGASDPLIPADQALHFPEPVLVQASCSGAVTVTRFEQTVGGQTGPVTVNGSVSAVAAAAPNDAWAAVGSSQFTQNAQIILEGPHLYLFEDGTPPQAPAGDDNETRPLQLQLDPPIIVFEALPPPPPPPPDPTPVVVVAPAVATTQQLPPAISGVKVKLHTKLFAAGKGRIGQKFTLDLTFKVSRPVMLGLEAFKKQRLVGSTGLKSFKPTKGTLSLAIVRTSWPTKLAFVNDSPSITLLDPGTSLHGTVGLGATASVLKGRQVASVRYDYAAAGSTNWSVIGTASSSPFTVQWDTTSVPNGAYQLRAVVTDSAGVAAISKTLANRQVSN